MRTAYRPRIRVCPPAMILPALLLLFGCQTMSTDPTGTSTGSNQNSSGASGPTLFVLDGQFGITTYANALTANGNVSPVTNLSLLSNSVPRSFVVTKTGQLIVSLIDDRLLIFDNAKTVTGNAAANRVVKGDATLFNFPQSLALDVANDRLYVAGNHATDGILVFEHVSSTAFNGNVAPDRTFIPDSLGPMNVSTMSLDSTGALFVYDSNTRNIVVFANAGSLSGVTVPTQIFTSDVWGSIENMTVDHADVLYAVDGGDSVFIFKNALSLNGDVSPDAVLTPKGNPQINNVAVASNGRGFVCDNVHEAILVFANIATRSGSVAADATIAGSKTQIQTPFEILLVP